METGDPFENCHPLSSVSPYSVLLGARLGAIRAQKAMVSSKSTLMFAENVSFYVVKFPKIGLF